MDKLLNVNENQLKDIFEALKSHFEKKEMTTNSSDKTTAVQSLSSADANIRVPDKDGSPTEEISAR